MRETEINGDNRVKVLVWKALMLHTGIRRRQAHLIGQRLKLSPQLQLAFALGLENWNPPPTSLLE